ncbi:primosomal protein N' [Nocardiopsis dassonvillei]|uniref:primosomal protein N' family DNA-binding protein n=1 Tax=Nocardiopsis dassonvillei TaxID=2014 RepID=UPI0008FC428E|nr:primosomal protein N' [Nocardiopsis dassonvillei]APC34619.1 primosomal protein N' [Nocardiopsis dassonvillei]
MTAQPGQPDGVLFELPEQEPEQEKATARAASRSRRPAPRRPAERLPVARVVVDTPLPHLDRYFDYRVPADMDEAAVPGCRVKVRFNNRQLGGFLAERVETSEFSGRLAYLEAVVSPEPVLTPEILGLARAVADRYAGTLSDVLRLAVPPRHARVEKEAAKAAEASEATGADASPDAAGVSAAPEAAESGAAPETAVTSADPEMLEPGAGSGTAVIGAPPETAGSGANSETAATATTLGTTESGVNPGMSGAEASSEATGVSANPKTPGAAPSWEIAATGADPNGAPSVTASGEAPGTAPGGTPEAVPPGARTGPEAPSNTADTPRAPATVTGPPPATAATQDATGAATDPGPWADYPEGPSFLRALRAGQPARAVWNALPGTGWADAVAVAAVQTLAAGRGTVVVVPDGRDVRAVDHALEQRLGEGRYVALTADLGPAERYRRWLSVLRGAVRVVVGTRAAVFAPVRDLGLVVLWDDGDDVHADPHAPYPHARTVLSMRAHRAGAGALIGGHTRTTDAQLLVESGWAHPLTADRATLRRRAPVVRAAGDDRELARDEAARSARMPSVALRAAREAARTGPVLFQVPRRGYLNTLACAGCREPARCDSCRGPLAVRGSHAMPSCGWCGRVAGQWACPECGVTRMRAVVVGARRTAEELGRAFPSLTVRTSGREEVLSRVADAPSLVVATPGAEPVADNGYAAAVLLDGWALLNRMDLRASEEALRRWLNAGALVRPGGTVVVSADASLPVVQSFVRWDPAGFAERELAERRELEFPPAVAMASVTGAPEHVRELLDQIELPEGAELLGPVPVGADRAVGPDGAHPTERALLRVPRAGVGALSRSLKVAASARSARRDEHLAQVRMDPLHVV